MHVYEVRPRKDKRGIDLFSDGLPFGRLWYGDGVVRRFNNSRNSCGIVMLGSLGEELIGARKPGRTRSRTPKSRHRRQKSTEHLAELWPNALDEPSDEHESEKPDRLMLSSLRFWEVERDLIEERLGDT